MDRFSRKSATYGPRYGICNIAIALVMRPFVMAVARVLFFSHRKRTQAKKDSRQLVVCRVKAVNITQLSSKRSGIYAVLILRRRMKIWHYFSFGCTLHFLNDCCLPSNNDSEYMTSS